jgi:hypothetical protein
VINFHQSSIFNEWINKWGLIELKDPARSYTWSNNQEKPIMAVLDRVFGNVEWDSIYPLTSMRILPRETSDHNPLKVCFGDKLISKGYTFRFEKWWLEAKGFEELVRQPWEEAGPVSEPIDVWQYKIRKLRKKVKGWCVNMEAEKKKRKGMIISDLDALDKLAEQSTLSDTQSLKRQELREELEGIWLMEETKARQRSRERDVKEGDRNTSFFFALANQRKRKKYIASLEEDGVNYNDNKSMLTHAMSYYKKNCLVRKKVAMLRWEMTFGRRMRWSPGRRTKSWKLTSQRKRF